MLLPDVPLKNMICVFYVSSGCNTLGNLANIYFFHFKQRNNIQSSNTRGNIHTAGLLKYFLCEVNRCVNSIVHLEILSMHPLLSMVICGTTCKISE